MGKWNDSFRKAKAEARRQFAGPLRRSRVNLRIQSVEEIDAAVHQSLEETVIPESRRSR